MGALDFLGLGSSIVGSILDQKKWEDFMKRYDEQYREQKGYADSGKGDLETRYAEASNNAVNNFNRYKDRSARGQDALNKDVLKRYGDTGAGLLRGRDENYAGVEDYAGGRRDSVAAAFGSGADAINSGYGARTARVLDYLRGAGEQEGKDINEQFNSATGRIATDLNSRGFGNSTIGASMRSGLERNRSDALGGLKERIRNQYATYDSALSGDELASRTRANEYGSGLAERLSGDVLGLKERNAADRGAVQQKYGDMFLGRYDDAATDSYNNRNMLDREGVDMQSQYALGGMDLTKELQDRYLGVLGNREQIAPQTSALSNIGSGLMTYRAGQQQARATERAGRRNMWGQIGGGFLGAAGSAAGGGFFGKPFG